MSKVDLDFQETLKETNFPDLLQGVSPSTARKRKKKRSTPSSPNGVDQPMTPSRGETSNSASPATKSVAPPDETDSVLDQLLDENYCTDEKYLGQTDELKVHSDFFESDMYTSRAERKQLTPPASPKQDFVDAVAMTPTKEALPVTKEEGTTESGGLESVTDTILSGLNVICETVNKSMFLQHPGASDVLKDEPADNTSRTAESDEAEEVFNLDVKELCATDEQPSSQTDPKGDSDRDSSTSHESSTASSGSEDAAALLQRAQDRVARQSLQDEINRLKDVLEAKNTEIETLTGQLRQATETKCDLVIAHKELEKKHENTVRYKNYNLITMKKANQTLLERQSAKEKELLNEIIRVTNICRDIQRKHREELDDWERMHRNEMLEKDFEIAKISEKLRKLAVVRR